MDFNPGPRVSKFAAKNERDVYAHLNFDSSDSWIGEFREREALLETARKIIKKYIKIQLKKDKKKMDFNSGASVSKLAEEDESDDTYLTSDTNNTCDSWAKERKAVLEKSARIWKKCLKLEKLFKNTDLDLNSGASVSGLRAENESDDPLHLTSDTSNSSDTSMFRSKEFGSKRAKTEGKFKKHRKIQLNRNKRSKRTEKGMPLKVTKVLTKLQRSLAASAKELQDVIDVSNSRRLFEQFKNGVSLRLANLRRRCMGKSSELA